MNHRNVIIAMLGAVFATAANADAIDPCSLLADTEKVELGLSKDAVPLRESQPGGVQACKYPFRSAGTAPDGMVTILLAQAVPERVLQLRALQAQARGESTPSQQQARGEYYEDPVMCKVLVASQQETSQCLGTSELSVVGVAISRPNPTHEVIYPAAQLRLTATLVSRIASRGG